MTAYKDTADVKKVQSTGIHIAGEKFVVIKADDRSLYGKKAIDSFPSRTDMIANKDVLQGKEGVMIVKTTQAILITHYPETVQPGAASTTVEQLADYLIGVGY